MRAAASPSRIQAIRFWSFGDVTRVAIETSGEYKLTSEQLESPPRLVFDLHGLRPLNTAARTMQTVPVGDRVIRQIRVAATGPGVSRVVFDLETASEFTASQLVNPDRLMIEVRPKGAIVPTSLTSRSRTGVHRTGDNGSSTVPATDDIAEENSEASPEAKPASVTAAALTSALNSKAQQAETAASGKTPAQATVTPPPQDSDEAMLPKSTLVWHGQARSANVNPSKPAAPPARPKSQPEAPTSTAALKAPSHKNAAATSETPDASPIPQASSKSSKPSGKEPAPVAGRRETPAAIPDLASLQRRDDASRSLVRVFGLKIHKVVIDAGHGGHDTGTIGRKGLMEKDLVLDVALRLGKLVEQRLGAEVVYTRSTDVFIPLETRTRIANEEQADLFISVHANSSPTASATGVETFYFNFTDDRNSLDLATRENASSDSSIFQLNDLLHKAVLNAKVEESRDFAQRIQSSLQTMAVRMNSASHDRGVKKAPFVVLIGATMPSILAEIGFVSNPHDERLLQRNDQRQKIAESLYKGIAAYSTSLGHTEVAQSETKKNR